MKNSVVERVDRLVIVENGVRELEKGLELKLWASNELYLKTSIFFSH